MRKGKGGSLTLCDRMKTKNFYLASGFILISFGTLWLLSYPSPTIQKIVNKTHKGIKNLPSNIQIQRDPELTVNPLYLSRLGLDEHNLSQGHEDNGSGEVKVAPQPVVASSVGGKQSWKDTQGFMESVAEYMKGYHLIMFDLSASEDTNLQLTSYCNNSWGCEVRKFPFDMYPSHVSDLSLRSYRPICIQEALNSHGAVIWADSSEYFQQGNVSAALRQAAKVGLVAWSIEDPTSAITHPKMFRFFKTKQDLYYFHRAVETSHMVLYNTPTVQRKIMLPWVKCALLEECIKPTGAQSGGCNFLRKPLFKYSGCHYYDMSALNVILGPLFDFSETPYVSKEALFGNFKDDRLAAKNASDPLHRSRLKLREYLNGRVNDAVV